MKALCTLSSNGIAEFQVSGEMPEPGKYYYFEDATKGSGEQNRAFHSCLISFWHWMNRTDSFVFEDNGRVFDLTTPDPDNFKDFFKRKYGEGFSHFEYVNDKFAMVRVKTFEEIPDYVIEDFNTGNRFRIKGVLKSWTKYTMKQRTRAIQALVDIIAISKCDDMKVHKILEGMNEQ